MVDPRHGGVGFAHVLIRSFARVAQFVAELVLRALKLPHGLAHSLRQLRQLLRAEEQEDDQQNDDQFLSPDVAQKCEQIHNGTNIGRSPWVARLFPVRPSLAAAVARLPPRLNVVVHLEFVRMRAEPQGVVFLLLHLDPVVDEVSIENVAPKEKRVVGFQGRDRSA